MSSKNDTPIPYTLTRRVTLTPSITDFIVPAGAPTVEPDERDDDGDFPPPAESAPRLLRRAV
jgi:hypothetical protein